MSTYEDLPPIAPVTSRTWQALVANTVTAFDELLYVRIPDFSATYRWGPCKWNQRYYILPTNVAEGADSRGDTEPSHVIPTFMYPLYPHRDDEALVIFDNNRELWVICWWPKHITGSGNRG